MDNMAQFWWISGLVLSTVLGLILGSFATMLIYRVPRDLPLLYLKKKSKKQAQDVNRSYCPACQAKLGFMDLIPVISWLFLRGKCRYCGAPIHPRYLWAELACMALCVGAYVYIGDLNPALYILWLVVPVLVAMIFIDWEHHILPDILNISLGVLALTYAVWDGDKDILILVLAGAVYASLAYIIRFIFLKIMKKEALGLGDVKFFGAAGLWIGFANLPLFLFLSGILGIIFGVFYRFSTGQERFPFGPALIVALILSFIFPSILIIL